MDKLENPPIEPGTPLPWACEDDDRIIRGPDGRTIARGHLRGTRHQAAEALANARYIVHACNLYPELVEALDALLTVAEMTTFGDQYPAECERARAALAKARGLELGQSQSGAA